MMRSEVVEAIWKFVGFVLFLLFAFAVITHMWGCHVWQHEEARAAAEMGCVERYKTPAQIEACREVVNGITSKYTKDAGPQDGGEQ